MCLIACLFICSLHNVRYTVLVECRDTKKYTKHVFNAAINNQRYSINYDYICKLVFMNVQTDRQTDEIHIHYVYMGLTQARPNQQLHATILIISNTSTPTMINVRDELTDTG